MSWTKKEKGTPVHPNRRSNVHAWFWRTQRPRAFPKSRLLFTTVLICKAYLCVGKDKRLRTISTSHDGWYAVVIVPLWFPRRQGVLGRWFRGGCLPCSSMEESHVDSSAVWSAKLSCGSTQTGWQAVAEEVTADTKAWSLISDSREQKACKWQASKVRCVSAFCAELHCMRWPLWHWASCRVICVTCLTWATF